MRGDLELARDYAGESLAIREELKDSKGQERILSCVAWPGSKLRLGSRLRARGHLKESFALAKAIGDKRTLSEAFEIAALVHTSVKVIMLSRSNWSPERDMFANALDSSCRPVRKKFIDGILTTAKGLMTESEYQGFQQRGESRDNHALIDLANLRANPQ